MNDAGLSSPFAIRRLWSLAEMMQFYAKPFLEADRLVTQLMVAAGDPNIHKFDSKALDIIRNHLISLIVQLVRMELRMSRLSAEAIMRQLENESLAPSSLRTSVTSLWERLRDEVETAFFIHLTDQEQTLYVAAKPFGEDVATKFPGAAVYEIEEASKCLGLGRSTAGAFHAIRCLEAGIKALSRCLGVPDPTKAHERNWGKMLAAIKAEIDRRWQGSSNRLTGDGQFFEEAYAALAAMQNPWRNATMHLDQKYTEEEAKHIFDMVRGFMRRVASRCDEDGEPKCP